MSGNTCLYTDCKKSLNKFPNLKLIDFQKTMDLIFKKIDVGIAKISQKFKEFLLKFTVKKLRTTLDRAQETNYS